MLAQWRPEKWFAGKIYKATRRELTVHFLNGKLRKYSGRSSLILRVKAKLPFAPDKCGPYGQKHAGELAALAKPSWPRRSRWAIAECMVHRRGDWKSEWYVGRIGKISQRRYSCPVTLNAGGRKTYDRAHSLFLDSTRRCIPFERPLSEGRCPAAGWTEPQIAITAANTPGRGHYDATGASPNRSKSSWNGTRFSRPVVDGHN